MAPSLGLEQLNTSSIKKYKPRSTTHDVTKGVDRGLGVFSRGLPLRKKGVVFIIGSK